MVVFVCSPLDALTGQLSTRLLEKLFEGQRGVNNAADDYAFDYVNHKVASFQSRFTMNEFENKYEELQIIEDISKVGHEGAQIT